MTALSLEQRIGRLEAIEDIRALVARYGYAIDDRDLGTVHSLFAPDAVFRSADGVMNAKGADAIIEQFRGRFAVLDHSNHFTHDHVITIDGPDHAHGLVNSHAELYRNGKPMVTALRYADRYVRHAGHWVFAERVLSFFYYLNVEDFLTHFGSRLRMRAYETPQAADWPEGTPTWRSYR